MKIEVTSQERIKPSKPTPAHLKTYKVCILDQLLPPVHIPIVFFYLNDQNDENNIIDQNTISENSQNLKKSLSETLTRFNHLAGKIKDNELRVDCNDDGVYYIETRVNCDLLQFLKDPDFTLNQKLIANGPNYAELEAGIDVVTIQVNIFDCGGVGLSMNASHQILDGTSLAGFFKDWAITAQGISKTETPSLVASSIFPPNKLLPKGTTLCMWPSMFRGTQRVTKRFVFSSESLVKLKEKVAQSKVVHNPTRVQSVFALIWKCATKAASKTRYGNRDIPSVLSLAVDIRRRSNPPLTKSTIGNLIWSAVAESSPETGNDLASLVGHLRVAISKVDTDYFQEFRGNEGYIKTHERLDELKKVYSNEDSYYFSCSSLCSSGMYDTNFGWGKPVWVCLGLEQEPLNVYLIDTRSGDGFEAWVSLPEEDMTEFESDPDIIAFTSLNPSPLKLCEMKCRRMKAHEMQAQRGAKRRKQAQRQELCAMVLQRYFHTIVL